MIADELDYKRKHYTICPQEGKQEGPKKIYTNKWPLWSTEQLELSLHVLSE